MDRDTIIKLARDAGIVFDDAAAPFYERFANLVAEHVRQTEFKPDWNNYRQGFKDGADAERETCAKVCDWVAAEWKSDSKTAIDCAAAIRARGNT
jgi:hypothetical protein